MRTARFRMMFRQTNHPPCDPIPRCQLGSITGKSCLKNRGKENDGDALVGRDPRDLPSEILSRYYGEKNPLKAIRARCLDCCCLQPSEVRKCVSVECPSWPFRMGINPFRSKRQLSDGQKRSMTNRLRHGRKDEP